MTFIKEAGLAPIPSQLNQNGQLDQLSPIEPPLAEMARGGEDDGASGLHWLEAAAGIACLIGIAGLIALLSKGAWAANPPPRPGFPQGNNTFTNPFANPGGNHGAFFDDDTEDNGANAAPQAGAQARTAPSVGRPAVVAAGAPGNGPISLEGKDPIVSHNRLTPLDINDETGAGPDGSELVTDFNFPDADILDIAKTLGKLTGKNFILDKDVKGRVTIISNSAITIGDAWRAFLTALDINGFALIPSGKMIRIARQRDARDKQLKTYTGTTSPDTDAVITRVFPLKYINAEEVARTFRNFMPANSRIIPYEQTNTVIVTDTGSNIAKLAKMLDLLDVEGYDAGIEVIPVKWASAADLAKLIDQLIPGTGASTGGNNGQPRFGGGGTSFGGGSTSHFSARRTKEGGIINTIIADERTNTLIVHANTKGADQVRELVAKLDQKLPASQGGGKVHVVYLQFADAEKIATTLNSLTTQTSTAPARPAGGVGGTGANPISASLFEGQIKVAPDVSTNALVVTASPSDFATVQRVISQLDIRRDEVYVEVVIMEVAINRDNVFSANIVSPTSGIGFVSNSDLINFVTSPLATTGAFFGLQAGKQTTITGPNNTQITVSSVQGLIKALQTFTRSNVLATPQIIALDNTEANFESTEGIPILTSTAVQGAGVSTSVGKQNVTLSIKIKPQINKLSNFVKLAVTSKLGTIENRQLPQAVQSQAYATLDRTTQTEVIVGDSDTIVLGGLIRDEIDETTTKTPILGDIPVLGWLFRSQETVAQKTNLLVFMTPHIIKQYDKVRAILDKKLKDRDDFLESNGGTDPLRPTRDDIIRNLPKIEDITRPTANSVTIDGEPTDAGNGNPFTGGVAPKDEKTTEKPTEGGSAKSGASTNPQAAEPGGATNPAAPAPLNVPEVNPNGTATAPEENAAPPTAPEAPAGSGGT